MENTVFNPNELDFKNAVANILALHKQFQPNHFERVFDLIIHQAEEYRTLFIGKKEEFGRLVEEIYYVLAYVLEDKINFEIQNNKKFFEDKYNVDEVVNKFSRIVNSGDLAVTAGLVGAEVVKLMVNAIAFKIKEVRLLKIEAELYRQMGHSLIKVYHSKVYLPGRYSLLLNTFRTNQRTILDSLYSMDGISPCLDLVHMYLPEEEHREQFAQMKEKVMKGKPIKQNILDKWLDPKFAIDWNDVIVFLGHLGAIKVTFFEHYKSDFISQLPEQQKYKKRLGASVLLCLFVFGGLASNLGDLPDGLRWLLCGALCIVAFALLSLPARLEKASFNNKVASSVIQHTKKFQKWLNREN